VTSSNDVAAEYSVDALAVDLGQSRQRLMRLVSRIDTNGYHQFVDRKGKKNRPIAAPADWLKALQRGLVDGIFRTIPVSDRVYSQRGRNVVKNAQQHRASSYLLGMDLKDCFPSTTLEMVRRSLLRRGLPLDVVKIVARLVTYHGRLPQGPPSSPAVFDCVFFWADHELEALARRHGAIYTRYMDDLCFSGPRPLQTLRREAGLVIRSHGFAINERKTVLSGPSEIHTVTNIHISASKLHPPPNYIRELEGLIRTFAGTPSKASAASIAGRIRWVKQLNEPMAESLLADFQSVAPREFLRHSAAP
jgi:RNA-directed DNA polymerase